MAYLLKKEYNEDSYYYDEDGCWSTPYAYLYQENGLKIRWFPSDNNTYICDICENVDSVDTPDYINTVQGQVKVLAWQVFNDSPGAKTVKHIHFGKGIEKFIAHIQNYLELESVEFNASVKLTPSFKGCTKLKSVTFRDDSPVEHLAYDCFSGCSALKSIILPRNLKYLDDTAFTGCDLLDSITVFNPTEQILESIVEIDSITCITIITDNGTKRLYSNALSELRRKAADERRKRKIEYERKQKYESFDGYLNQRSKRRTLLHEIVCALPLLYLLYRILYNEYEDVDLTFGKLLLGVFMLAFLLFIASIIWAIAYLLTAFVDYMTEERHFLISLLSPIVTIPTALLIAYISLIIISVMTTCGGGLAGIFDPAFL